MRFVLVALAIAGCYHDPGASTPANKAPAPDYRATAEDELGFLPVGADLVVVVNFAAFRGSVMWQSLQPQMEGFRRELAQLAGDCARPNPIDTMERATAAVNLMPNGDPHGVVVIRGVDTTRALDCIVQQTKKGGGTAVLNRGVAILTTGDRSQVHRSAAAVVGPSTLVLQLDPTVSYDTMTKILASGAPLRSSPSFMALYKRREPGASLWGMANGTATFFAELAQKGTQPKSLDGTLTVTDRLDFAVRMTMASPADAASLSAELDQVKQPAANFVQQFDTRVDDATLSVHVVLSEQQVRNLAGMLGGFGP